VYARNKRSSNKFNNSSNKTSRNTNVPSGRVWTLGVQREVSGPPETTGRYDADLVSQGYPARRFSMNQLTMRRLGVTHVTWFLLPALTFALVLGNPPAQAQESKAAAEANTQQPPKAKKASQASQAAKAPSTPPVAPADLTLEPKAIEILKAASSRLAAAKSMTFTAVISYESPSRLGPPLVYTTKSDVTLQRPDKLRVITPGDGPASEFYYDGKTMTAFAPVENHVAVADAPPTIDATLKAAYDTAAIYFPFTDVIVADPYQDVADGLRLAFYVGQSRVVGGTTTDIVAYANDAVFVQIWIGAEDKLPRMLRAVYREDPSRLRHQMELSNWQLDPTVPTDAFASAKASSATRIQFARPDVQLPPGLKPPEKGKPQGKRKTAKKTQ
jgi:hypothetical protein